MSGRDAVTSVTGLGQMRWTRAVAWIAGGLTLAWVVSALAMAGRGVDITDEGYYLLSYRWWSSNPRNASGVQYLYGPIFQAFGYSVRALRITRLVTVLGAHLVFAWAFLTWLRTRRPDVVAAPGTSWAVVLTLTAAGGVTYGWLPLSPGYNDVAMLGSLTMAAALLFTVAGAAGAGGRLPLLPAVMIGPSLVAIVLAKWSAAGVLLVFLAVIAVLALRPWRPSGVWRYVGVLVAGVLGSLALVDLFVKRFSEMVPPMLEVTRRVAASANSPAQLLPMYLRTAGQLMLTSLVVILVTAPVVALGILATRRLDHTLGLIVVALGPVLAVVVLQPSTFGLPGGGVGALEHYSSVLLAMAFLVAAVAVYDRRELRSRRPPADGPVSSTRGRGSDMSVVLLLVLLPLVQALGTGNALSDLAVNQIVCWVAAMVLTFLALPRDAWPRVLVGAATAVAVVVAATTGISGLLVHPYRTTGWAGSTVEVGGSGPLAGLKVSPGEAAMFRGVRTAVGPSLPAGSPVLAFDELAGLVLGVDGSSVGEPWYSASDRGRTAAGIASECADTGPIPPSSATIMFDRPPAPSDLHALASCGLGLGSAISTVPLYGTSDRVSVYRALRVRAKEGS